MMTKVINNRRGTGMLLGMLVTLVVLTCGMAVVSLTTTSLALSKREVIRTQALTCAESGIDIASSYLIGAGPNGELSGAWRTTHPSTDPDNHSSDTWYDIPGLPSGETCKVCVRTGSGVTAGRIVVTSIGTVTRSGATVSRTIKAALNWRMENVNVWNNAIFGGVGQAGKSINGNVQIRGSVHLLGDGEDFTDSDGDGYWDSNETYTDSNSNGVYNLGEPYTDTNGDGHRSTLESFVDNNGNGTRDPALTVTDLAGEMSGNANIGNNYSGMPADLLSKVPTIPQVTFGGETVGSLSANLRVKHGRVNISGSATVGDADSTGDTAKETLDGTYVSDGFGGTAGTGSVHADNGFTNGYDLADDLVNMPIIDTGSYSVGGTTYANYLTYLRANATIVTGDLSLLKGTARTISGPNGSIVLDADGNMTITGIVYVEGNISFGPKQSKITYEGSGTLVTPNMASVHCDLLPKTNFPLNDVLGLVCGDRIELANGPGDAQLTMAIAMYAQHKIISVKQNQIAGTMVSSYYQMSNVPSLYQVPELANHLPPGVPGSEPILMSGLSIESWQER